LLSLFLFLLPHGMYRCICVIDLLQMFYDDDDGDDDDDDDGDDGI